MRTTLFIGTLALLAGTALADEAAPAPLRIGEPAPAVDVAHWIKGVEMDARGGFTPLRTFPEGQATVLVFWASWSGPSRADMPLLSRLQAQYADQEVTIIGLSDESLPKVYAFLGETDRDGLTQHARTQYTLGTDPDRSVYRDYMEASTETDLPTAVLVGRTGLVEWIGHASGLPDVLATYTHGFWRRELVRAENDARQRKRRTMLRAPAAIKKAVAAEDWEGLVRIYDALIAADPSALRYRVGKLGVLLMRINDRDRACEYAEDFRSRVWDDANWLNVLAWQILTDEEILHQDVAFARRVATRAAELTGQQDAAILDTLARSYYEDGDLVEAIRWQEKAVAVAHGETRAEMQVTLEAYRTERSAAEPAERSGQRPNEVK